MRHLAIGAMAAALGMADVAAAQAPSTGERVEPTRIRLAAERAGVSPGGTVEIAMVFELEPGWHLYWPGRNDTGVSPRVTWDLPAGVKVGEVRWPAPSRQVSPGDLLDHVYEGRLLLTATLTAPADARVGSTLEIGAGATWMVCSDVCLLGKGKADLSLPVVDGEARPTPDAKAFAETRKRLAKPLPESGAGVSLSWDGPTLVVSAPGASSIAFYPGRDCASPANLLADGLAKGGTMRLRIEGDGVVEGIVEVRMAEGTSLIYWIEAPVER